MALNSQNIGTLPPRRAAYRDDKVLNLCLHVGVRRRRWFALDPRTKKEHTLGYYIHNAPQGSGSLGLGEARKKASETLLRLESGAPVKQEVKHPSDTGLTVRQTIDAYEQYRLKKGGKGLKSLDHRLNTVRRNLADWLDLPMTLFAKSDLQKARDIIAGRTNGTMADRFQAYLSPILKWAWEEDKIAANFAPSVRKVGPGTVRRKRRLTDDEIRAVWHAKPETAQLRTFHRLVKFLLAAAQRKMEGATLKHGEVIDGRWILAKEDTKSDREHRLKLPQLALDQLGEGTAGTFCFPGARKGGVLGNFSQLLGQLHEISGTSGWALHDLRRTATSAMQDMTDEDGLPLVSRDVISAIMNHAIDGADGHYLYGAMLRAKERALGLWAGKLAEIVEKQPPQKVVPLCK
ncbi:hypothetical protein GOB10_18455 [Sinorhizobium meliloti]|uniref:tyrosine-type recombinase/integrase n=1 Tax=Rhizobium meliloti TaxID=382 RepID=UPI00299D4BC4|nr:hypothetical protein [Sinorhizobium meliloti]MDW9897730.1 hypothetical protein [Sinorhizobium meliloti]MDX0345439.1 hypothetical protein [Sinorhizobium meliloti]MDX0856767.1 hypothetical protein [Sinorhizobium medicae]MDX1211770.1 hypothetical protein [Sinorhizobium medicae]